MIRKVWTSQYIRVSMATYAESGRRDIDVIGYDIAAVMRLPGAQFYKLENTAGVFVGFVIEIDGLPATGYIRPHLQSDAAAAFLTV